MWYLAHGQERVGPLSLDDLTAKAARGELLAESYVWQEGLTVWQHAGEIEELRSVLPPVALAVGPPPIPPPVPSGLAAHLAAFRGASAGVTVKNLADRVTDAVGVDRLQNFSLKQVFSQALARHDESEIEAYFTVGTRGTTPSLADVSTAWPAPWMFVRLLGMSLLVYVILLMAYQTFGNINLVPGLIIVGSFAVPLATVVFFFETNVVRNVPLYYVLRLIFLGGAVSLALSLVLYTLPGLGWFGAPIAGIVEEVGKLAALVFVTNRLTSDRQRLILNGLLFGAAVGCGFAAFESAGYALRLGLLAGRDAMIEVIHLRGLLAPFGHIVWTGLVAAALWHVRDGQPVGIETVKDKRFFSVLGAAVILHAVWNVPFTGPFWAKYWVLGAAAWVLVFSFIQMGLRQVGQLQLEAVNAAPGLVAAR